MANAGGHGAHDDAPSSSFGQAVQDVLKVAPQLVATLQAKPDDHHGHGHDKPTSLGPEIDGLVQEINEGIEKKRSPAGLVAASVVAIDRILTHFAGMNAEPGAAKSGPRRGSGALAGAALAALAIVAGGFLLFGSHTDVVYPAGSDADYRSLAFQGAVDAPNLGVWLAWIVLILAAAGGIAWLMNQTPATGGPRIDRDEPQELRKSYENGGISHHLYQRGRMLLAARSKPGFKPTIEAAEEHAAYAMALADALRHRRDLDAIQPNKSVTLIAPGVRAPGSPSPPRYE